MPRETTDDWICVACGCSNNRACSGGCAWIAENKCSACFDIDGAPFAVGADDGGLFGIDYCPASETRAPHVPLFADDVTCYCARCKIGLAA